MSRASFSCSRPRYSTAVLPRPLACMSSAAARVVVSLMTLPLSQADGLRWKRVLRTAFRSRDCACSAQNGGTVVREVLSRQQRTKLDSLDDRQFYSAPRIVKHVDEGFLAQVTQLYRERIPDDGVVLDLMSSWVSHLPPEKKYAQVIGHGMDGEELLRNPRLDDFFVRNLNFEPDGWRLGDQSVDAVLCCVSVQYLQQPERVFAEVYRVLKPGGVFIVTFSNRMFYEKAIAAWRDQSDYGHCQLVRSYFQAVSGFTDTEVLREVQLKEEPASRSPFMRLFQNVFKRAYSDPFFAVLSYKDFKPSS